jgi:putative ABC transport system permease protein
MILILAWRNIWRNRSRSLITMASVITAVLLSVLTASLQKGVFDNLIRNVVSLYTGYVQVHAAGYWEEQILENSFEYKEELRAQVSAAPGIVAASARLETFALASSGEKSRGCMAIGIQPDLEDQITRLRSKVVEGRFLEAADDGVLVAGGLAQKLALRPGDTLILLSQGYYGSTAAGKYVVRGLLKFGSPDLNNSVVYLPLATAQYWLDAPERATALAFDLVPGEDPMDVTRTLQAGLPDTYEVMSWKEMMPEIVQHIESDTAGMYIFLGVLYLLISFGIFSTLLMMLAERQQEFGMLVALGMHKIKIARLILLESVMLTMSGALVGVLLSLPVTWYFSEYPLRFGGDMAVAYERFGFEAIFPATMHPSVFLIQTIIIFFIGIVLSLYPAMRVMKLDPVQAMRR